MPNPQSISQTIKLLLHVRIQRVRGTPSCIYFDYTHVYITLITKVERLLTFSARRQRIVRDEKESEYS